MYKVQLVSMPKIFLVTVRTASPFLTHPTWMSALAIDPLGEIPIPTHPVVRAWTCNRFRQISG